MSESTAAEYKDFTARLKILFRKHPNLIVMTLSNIFTMRLIGNKTHGDLAEIAMSEFINQYMYDFRSVHVGKDLYRAKSHEEDIKVINEITNKEFPVSLKAYGNAYLQLSTDKTTNMFKRLDSEGEGCTDRKKIKSILSEPMFDIFKHTNVLPLIYDEKKNQCNIMVFDYETALKNTCKIVRMNPGAKRRKHPAYVFLDETENYICEVRYGDTSANPLQRGLWTHTKKGLKYFDSLTEGWISYSHNHVLIALFSHALISSATGHEAALEKIKEDILRLKTDSKL